MEAVATGAVAGRKAVDFENLSFAQGNHLMTNKKCDLPQKSYRTAQKVGQAAMAELHIAEIQYTAFIFEPCCKHITMLQVH